jgi:diguanylate cyclase (GGDEF)-like protein
VLRDTLRAYDLAVRFGPRQLLAILPGVTATSLASFAERFRREVERTSIEGLPRATVSGGVAELDPSQDVERLLATAAAALAEAQRQGGNLIL